MTPSSTRSVRATHPRRRSPPPTLPPPAGLLPGTRSGELEVPPLTVCGHKLGIAFWCVPSLYVAASAEFQAARGRLLRPRARQTDGGGDGAEGPGPTTLPTTACWARLARSSRAMVLISADCYTAWNARKRMVTAGRQPALDELRLTALVLTKHPKSGECWSHRRWLLLGDTIHPEATLLSELDVCARAAQAYPRNYFAWCQRGQLSALLRRHPRGEDAVRRQLEGTSLWLRTHPSDGSGWRHCQLLLRLLCPLGRRERGAKPEPCTQSQRSRWEALLETQFELTEELTERYPGHAALWVHRRALWGIWLQWMRRTHWAQDGQHAQLSQLAQPREIARGAAAAGAAGRRLVRALGQRGARRRARAWSALSAPSARAAVLLVLAVAIPDRARRCCAVPAAHGTLHSCWPKRSPPRPCRTTPIATAAQVVARAGESQRDLVCCSASAGASELRRCGDSDGGGRGGGVLHGAGESGGCSDSSAVSGGSGPHRESRHGRARGSLGRTLRAAQAGARRAGVRPVGVRHAGALHRDGSSGCYWQGGGGRGGERRRHGPWRNWRPTRGLSQSNRVARRAAASSFTNRSEIGGLLPWGVESAGRVGRYSACSLPPASLLLRIPMRVAVCPRAPAMRVAVCPRAPPIRVAVCRGRPRCVLLCALPSRPGAPPLGPLSGHA